MIDWVDRTSLALAELCIDGCVSSPVRRVRDYAASGPHERRPTPFARSSVGTYSGVVEMHEVQQRSDLPAVHLRPSSVDETLDLLAVYGDRACLIAGGTDLILEFARGQHDGVEALIDLSSIHGEDAITSIGNRTRIGMLVTHNQIVGSSHVWETARPLAEACLEIGSAQLRNRATVVGNIATASPANDTITALRVLDAEVTLRSVRGERTVALGDFHTGVRLTLREADELITSISFRQLGKNERGVFVKAGLRAAQAISVVHAAMVMTVEDGVVQAVKIALGSVAPTIVEAPVDGFVGGPCDSESIAAVARAAAQSVRPIDDVRATAAYRSESVRVIVQRGLESLLEPRPAPDRAVLLSPGGSAFGSGDATTINGLPVEVADTAGLTLLDWLRDVAGPTLGEGLTGTKEGCAEGECGACTVQMNGAAVMSCLVPAASVAGSAIVTVEGVGIGGLHAIQQAFVDKFAVQCGYCIPGFIVAGASLLDEISQPSPVDIADGLAGNLCRCTGYYKIIEAVVAAGASGAGA